MLYFIVLGDWLYLWKIHHKLLKLYLCLIFKIFREQVDYERKAEREARKYKILLKNFYVAGFAYA